jgi:pimeloyl-ACP methyl ester carboxylesterase
MAVIVQYLSPTLLIAGEKDILFPGEKVIARAKTIIPNIETHLMPGSGHMSRIGMKKHAEVVEFIVRFLK